MYFTVQSGNKVPFPVKMNESSILLKKHPGSRLWFDAADQDEQIHQPGRDSRWTLVKIRNWPGLLPPPSALKIGYPKNPMVLHIQLAIEMLEVYIYIYVCIYI